MDKLVRNVSQLLLSKMGGNVNHNSKTALTEFTDNSLDANAKNITITKEFDDGSSYLVIIDDGDGIENILNIFTGDTGKKGKKGCKNQGFLDALVFFSNVNGEIDIISNCNNKYDRISVNFSGMKEYYNSQFNDKELHNIDYKVCDKLLLDNFIHFKNHTIKNLDAKIMEKLKNHGTYIKIPLYKDFNLEDIDIRLFDYYYTHKFNLNYLGNSITIDSNHDICEEKNGFETLQFNLLSSNSISGEKKLFRFENNFNEEKQYFKKNSKIKSITQDEYEKCNTTSSDEILKARFKFSCISPKLAMEQNIIYYDEDGDKSIEKLRQLYVSYEDKSLGPFKFPKKIKGLTPRNLLEVRPLLEIHDEEELKKILMANKGETNFDDLYDITIKFINYCSAYLKKLTYDSDIGKKFKKIKDTKGIETVPGIKNLKDYFTKKSEEEDKLVQRSVEEEISKNSGASDECHISKQLPSQEHVESKLKVETFSSIECSDSENAEVLLKSVTTSNILSWRFATYFGVKNCTERGIKTKDEYIECHFGITKADPKKRDSGSGLGPKWRRLFYTHVNNQGSKSVEGHYKIEWEIKKRLKELKDIKEIKWKSIEYFECHKDDFKKIYQTVRDEVTKYEEFSW